jgi:putative copper export protein
MRAGVISWQLAQTFWVGGLWLLQFVMLPALVKIGLAPLLIEEIASNLRPLLVGFAAFCVLLQAVVLIQLSGFRSLWQDLRGQLLLSVLLLAASYFAVRAGFVESPYWLVFSYLVMGLCGLILVLQVAPGRER